MLAGGALALQTHISRLRGSQRSSALALGGAAWVTFPTWISIVPNQPLI